MRSFFTSIFFAAVICINAQSAQTIPQVEADNWWTMMQHPNGNFYDIQSKFNQYWATRDITEKGKGYKAFKRWEYFTERRVFPSGDLGQLNLTAKNFSDWLNNNQEYIYHPTTATGKLSTPSAMIASTTWTAIGPMGPISGSAGGQLLKSGRICFISVSPTNSNVLFIGAPAGGLWKSTNGGTNWTTVTDNFPVTGFSDLAFDPTNTNILYAATGDGDAGDTYCNGVYKSTDGGTTWNITGLTFAVSSGVRIRHMVVNPSNPLIVIAVASNGVWRTTNGGTTWTQYLSGTGLFDVEFMPGNPNTVYCTGTTFRLSTDGGITWTQISAGIPTTGSNRMAIAVSPNNANYVWVVAGSSANSGMLGIYKSTNSGTSFTQMTTTLNLLGYNSAGNDVGGQSWYDLCIACNPLNVNEVVVGGVNVWRTTDGAATWGLYGHWTGSGAPFTHADQHDLEYFSNGTLFNTNDGTVYRRTAAAWQEISGTINISQIYKIGLSSLSNLWITGHQDNGTSTWNGTTYTARMGGDGMDCFIDRTNDANMWAEYYNGNFQKSTNGGVNWASCQTGLSGAAPWVTIWKQDPVVATRLYAGLQNMFVSNNSAGTWTMLTALPAGGSVVEFAICPSNNQVIYVVKSNNVFRSQDGGSTWATVTGTIPVGSAGLQNLCVSPTNTANVWVVGGNYSAGNKVWYSTNGGATWTNWSANLPNLPGNCLFYQPGSTDRIYVGMDVGVYYRDPSQANWTLYNTGLPNTPMSDMKTSAAFPNKIVGATYGRGVWMVDFAPSALPPVTSFAYSGTICAGVPKVFYDNSTNAPSTWSWSVTPSAGVTINTPASQSPTITFNNAGNYTVAMTSSNTNGPGNTYTIPVTVNPNPTVTIAASANTICAGSPVTFTASGTNSYTWSFGPTTATASASPIINTTYSVTGISAAGCTGIATRSVAVQPSITVNANATSTSICAPSSVTLSANGATTYTWQPGNLGGSSVVVTPASNTTYTVTGTTGVCNNVKMLSITVASNVAVSAIASSPSICASQGVTLTASGATTYTWQPGNMSGNSVVVTPASNTTYTVNGTTGSCNGSSVVAVAVNPAPNVTASSSNTLICAGTAATITASGANTYSWSSGPTTSTIVVFPVLTTIYTVTGTDANGCSNTYTVQQDVQWCTTLTEFNLGAENYKAFPNPFADEIKFSANEQVDITMYNELGQIVKQTSIKNSGSMATNDLSAGVYIVFMKGKSGIKTIRLLREKN